MSLKYLQIRPEDRLVTLVDSFWSLQVERPEVHTILPDGCADCVFYFKGDTLTSARFAGVLTRPMNVPLEAGQSVVGVRFRPGMAGLFLPTELRRYNDRCVDLSEALREDAPALNRAAAQGKTLAHRVEAISGRLSASARVQEISGGFDDFLGASKLSERQLRRACSSRSGLSPKRLEIVLRFRKVVAGLERGERSMSGLASQCGYSDQSHMIRDFRRLAGMTPTRYAQHLARA